MKNIMVILFLILAISASHAQQYGWQVIARPMLGESLEAVDFVDPLHGWCGGRDSIFRTTDGGFTWRAVEQPNFRRVLSISFSDTLHGWAAGVYGGPDGMILGTKDGGRSWQQQLYSYPCNFKGTAALSVLKNITIGYTTVAPDTAKIFRTTDSGISWEERTFAPDSYFLKIAFVDSLRGYVTGEQRSILKTLDGGASWERLPINFGASAFSFLDTLHGWAASGGSFYRTRDGGTTWDSLFTVPFPGDDFAAEKLSLVDTLNGWAFGWAFYQGTITEAIYRTTDGGTTWFRESIGLTDDLGELHDGKMIDIHHGWAVALDGRVLSYQPITNVVEKLLELPTGYSLRQNYPNPFNPTTTIEYELPKQNYVTMKIYDARGAVIATLVDQMQMPGVYRVKFGGESLATGTYFVTLESDGFEETRQMLYLK